MPKTAQLRTFAGAAADKTEYVSGYMPLRGDFDVEHDNDAELILADMEFSPEDHESERELKLKIIEIYNSKLDERERRKKFVLERGLLSSSAPACTPASPTPRT